MTLGGRGGWKVVQFEAKTIDEGKQVAIQCLDLNSFSAKDFLHEVWPIPGGNKFLIFLHILSLVYTSTALPSLNCQ